VLNLGAEFVVGFVVEVVLAVELVWVLGPSDIPCVVGNIRPSSTNPQPLAPEGSTMDGNLISTGRGAPGVTWWGRNTVLGTPAMSHGCPYVLKQ
jgi:hypothetical protein